LKIELSRALIVDGAIAPSNWGQFILAIVRDFYLRTDDPAEKDQWRIYIAEAESRYRFVAGSSAAAAGGREASSSVGGEPESAEVIQLRSLYSDLRKEVGDSDLAANRRELLMRYESRMPGSHNGLRILEAQLEIARSAKERLAALEDWLQSANQRLLLKE
jgi:hypothetical protein